MKVRALLLLLLLAACGPSSGSRAPHAEPPIRAGNWTAYPYAGGHKDKLTWLTETTTVHQQRFVQLQGETPGLIVRYVPSAASVGDEWRVHDTAGHSPTYPHQWGFVCPPERLVVVWAGPKDEGWSLLHHAAHAVYGDPGHTMTWNPNTALTSKPVVDWWDIDLHDFNLSLALSAQR